MIYGNKLVLILFLFSFLLIVGCKKENDFNYELYDGYKLIQIDDSVKLYKDNDLVTINDLDYDVKSFKYNSDVVCLKLNNDTYYMIYYFDSSIYGPYTNETLNDAILSLSMTFSNDFLNIDEIEGNYE